MDANAAANDLCETLARQGLALGSPGVVVATLAADGTAGAAAAGVSSLALRDPIRVDHRFAIGSITKTVVAVVVHQLVGEGRLDLDATAADYLAADVVAGIANAGTAPLRTLLNHTSGIPTWEFDPDWIRRGRGDRFDKARPFGKTDTLAYIRDRHVATGAVGAHYAYSNTNFTMLGLVIESATGNEFVDEARRRVFEPIATPSFAMESFEPIPAGALACAHHLATPFFRETAGMHPSFPERSPTVIDTSAGDLSAEWAAGGYVATMGDLARYGAALSNDAFGVGVGKAMRDFRNLDATPTAPYPRRVGLGLFEFETPWGRIAGHFGGTLGYCAALLFPAHGTGQVVTVGFNLGRMHTESENEHAAWQGWVLREAYPRLAGGA